MADSGKKALDYRGKVVLAPMVRIGTLPTRLLSLQYGADLVYTEELIDYKILSTQRVVNNILGTVDYVLSDTTLVFRTCPAEKDRLVFQMGTANAEVALRAAKKIENDVSAIDINMGCPKEFSLKGGMGAALLKKPDKVKEILTTLVNGLSIPVTCKIRLLPKMEDTISLVQMIEQTGVSAIGIHGRLTEERPKHNNNNKTIKQLAQLLHIPVIANGGSKEHIKVYDDIERFRVATGASSVMVARAAEWNTSIFRKEGKLPIKHVVRDYIKLALDTDNPFSNTKYCILMMMHADMDQEEGLQTQECKCTQELCSIWGLTDYMETVETERKKKEDQADKYLGIKRRKMDDGKILIEMPLRFIKKDYPVSKSPKLKLYEWTVRNKVDKAFYITTERTEDRCYKCVLELDNKAYTSTLWEKSKQLAEQAAAIVALVTVGEHDGRKADSQSHNDEIARVWREEFQMNEQSIYRHKAEDSVKTEDNHMDSETVSQSQSEMPIITKGIQMKNMNQSKIIKKSEKSCDKHETNFNDQQEKPHEIKLELERSNEGSNMHVEQNAKANNDLTIQDSENLKR